jgi:hypothetical protein
LTLSRFVDKMPRQSTGFRFPPTNLWGARMRDDHSSKVDFRPGQLSSSAREF